MVRFTIYGNSWYNTAVGRHVFHSYGYVASNGNYSLGFRTAFYLSASTLALEV